MSPRHIDQSVIDQTALTIIIEGITCLEILQLRAKGGPTDADIARVRADEEQERILVDTETFLGALRKEDHQRRAGALAAVARALAVLSFCPGGVTFCGRHYESHGSAG